MLINKNKMAMVMFITNTMAMFRLVGPRWDNRPAGSRQEAPSYLSDDILQVLDDDYCHRVVFISMAMMMMMMIKINFIIMMLMLFLRRVNLSGSLIGEMLASSFPSLLCLLFTIPSFILFSALIYSPNIHQVEYCIS